MTLIEELRGLLAKCASAKEALNEAEAFEGDITFAAAADNYDVIETSLERAAVSALPRLLDAIDKAEGALKEIIGVPVESVPGHIETASGWQSYSSRCHGCIAKENKATAALAAIHELTTEGVSDGTV